MRFRLEHHFAAAAEDVQAVYVDPAFYASLDALPRVGKPELLGQEEDGGTVVQRIRYLLTADLPSAARRVVDPAKLTWVAETTYQLAELAGAFRMVPDHYRDRLRCSGSFRFDAEGGGSRRIVEGELSVKVPLVAGTVERAILSGVEEHLESEAAAVDDWVTQYRGGLTNATSGAKNVPMASYLWLTEDGWPYPDSDHEEADLSVDIDVDQLSLVAAGSHLLDSLVPLEREVVSARFGLDGARQRSITQLHHDLGVSRSELRHALSSGLMKLRTQLA